MSYYEELIHLFKERGFKITPQRMAVFQALDGNKNHPTADEIYTLVKTRYPNMSFTTVYNILKSIRETGAIRELFIEKERVHFDPDMSPHHHIICQRCGRIDDVIFSGEEKPGYPKSLDANYRVTGMQINYFGICNNCCKGER